MTQVVLSAQFQEALSVSTFEEIFGAGPVFGNEASWDNFWANFDSSAPITEISNSRIAIADGDYLLELMMVAGSGISGISSESELMDAIELGLADGIFSSVVASDASGEVGRLDFTATGMTLISGAQSVVFTLALPASIQEVAQLAADLDDLLTLNWQGLTQQQQSDVVETLSNYGITGIAFDDGVSSFSFNLSSDEITLEFNGYVMTFTGLFPDQFGAMLELFATIDEIEETNGNVYFSDLTDLDLTSIVITNPAGEEVLNVSGDFDLDPTSLLLEGTNGNDVVTYNPFATVETYDVDLMGGDDTFHIVNWGWDVYDGTNTINFALDGGSGVDTLVVGDDRAAFITVDFSDAFGMFELSSPGITFAYSNEITGFENLVFSGYSSLDFSGSEADNTVQFLDIDGDSATFDLDGRGGIDTLDLTQIDVTGITLAQLLASVDVEEVEDNVFAFYNYEDDQVDVTLTDFEYVALSDGVYSLDALAAESNDAPVFLIDDQTVAASEWTRLSDVLTVTDEEGDAIVTYEIYDSVGGNNWYADGALVDASTGYTTSDLDGIWFRGDASASDQTLWVRGNDGTYWSTWESFTLTTEVNTPPVLAVDDQTVGASQWTRLSDVLDATDADGDAIVTYEVYDSVGGNNWYADGAVVDASTGYTTSNLAGIWFQGDAVEGDQALWVRGFDGEAWSDWSQFNLSTEVNEAPVLEVSDQVARPSEWTRLSDVLDATDADGDAIVSYEIYDSVGSNSWYADGALVDASTGYTTANLAGIWFQGDASPSDQTLWVRASDGEDWSAWEQFTLTTAANTAPVATVEDQTVGVDEWVRLTDVLSVSDAHDDEILLYEIYDSAGADNWYADGALVDAATGYQTGGLNGIWFQGDDAPGEQVLWVRAFDGDAWSDWDQFDLITI